MMTLRCKGPQLGPFASQLATPSVAYFCSATLAWNPTGVDKLARMAAIADVFGALTDRRVYKPGMLPEHAFKIMSKEMSRHLDMPLLERFRQMLLDTNALLEDA